MLAATAAANFGVADNELRGLTGDGDRVADVRHHARRAEARSHPVGVDGRPDGIAHISDTADDPAHAGMKLAPPEARLPASHASESSRSKVTRDSPLGEVGCIRRLADLDVDPQRIETLAVPIGVLVPVLVPVTVSVGRIGREPTTSTSGPSLSWSSSLSRSNGSRLRSASSASPKLSPSVSGRRGSEYP